MIKSLDFKSIESLNNFIRDNKIQVISIETFERECITEFKMPRGGYFMAKTEIYKLWYNIDETGK